MTAAEIAFVVLGVPALIVGLSVLAAHMPGKGDYCKGDALSGFLPCDDYPRCDCD